jgi:site-specific DNA-methyltransferase (adenine-specific)
MLDRVLNVAQRGDALILLRSLADNCTPLVFFDPQHRAVLDHLQFGNEGARQRGRSGLPAMSETYIDMVCSEIARVLKPSGYLMRWVDTFGLCEGHHLRIAIRPVDLIAWDSLRPGMGKRSRRRGDYLIVLQKPPIKAGSTWRDHAIPSRWAEKVDRKIHPDIKPIGLIARLIAATTEPGDIVVDPAAGSFIVLRVGRNFIGCDLVGPADSEAVTEGRARRTRTRQPTRRAWAAVFSRAAVRCRRRRMVRRHSCPAARPHSPNRSESPRGRIPPALRLARQFRPADCES